MTFADLAASATKDKDFAKEQSSNASTPTATHEEEDGDDSAPADLEAAPDVHFAPVVKLEVVETKTCEEDEQELFKIRAKMFRFEKESNEWKERGTGEVRLLQNPVNHKVRMVMRRDQTLKVCANHLVSSDITLKPNVGSDRSWVYNVIADVSDGGEPKPELFAIRFGNAENALLFKAKFEEAQSLHGVKAGTDAEPVVAEESKGKKSEEKKEEANEVENVSKSLEGVSLNTKPSLSD